MGPAPLLAADGAPQPGLTAAITHPQLTSVVLILAACTLGALLSRIHSRIVLPTVVLELVLGIAIAIGYCASRT